MDSHTKERMAKIFNEWAKRYSEEPEDFDDIFNEEGKPISDYGERATSYFETLANEMDRDGLLPKPIPVI